jgi:cation/acetate symporter
VAEPSPTALGALLAQPAVLSVPVAFVTMICVSLLDPERPEGTEETMLALHGPEGLGLDALRARG